MAVIQKIRNKYGKIAAGVIVLSLIGFILMDATSSGRLNDLFGKDESVVTVNGEKVDQKEYLKRQQEYEMLYKVFNPDFKMTDASRAQLNEQVLRELIYEKLVAEECDKLGITVSKEEEKELIYGADPYELIKQYPRVLDPKTKMFDPQSVKQFEQAINSPKTEIDAQTRAQLQEEWATLKAFAIRSYRTNKYNSAVMAGIVAPKFLVEQDLKDRQQNAAIRFVSIPYGTVSDDQAKVTDAEIKEYMEKHKAQYMVYDPTRSIEYISFDILPTGEDSTKSYGALVKLKDEFAAATDNETVVNRHSEDSYQDKFVNKRIFMSQFSDSIVNLPVGSVYGPYYENGMFKLSKVTDRKVYPDSAKFRLIRVVVKSGEQQILTDSAAQMRIDSAVAALAAGTPFAEVSAKFSDDENKTQTGGEYIYTIDQKEMLPKEVADVVFEGKVGDKKTVTIKNDNYVGLFYVEVAEQLGVQPAMKIATITKSLAPGNATDQAIFGKASEFAGKNNTTQSFDAAAKTHPGRRMAEGIKPNDFAIQGIEGGNVREIIRWTYDAKVGDVSGVFNLNGRYIVAKVSAEQKKGLPNITEANRPALEKKLKAEKKAKIITDKYKSMGSVDAIAQAANLQVQQADTVSGGNMFIPNLGFEPKVVGYTFYKGFQPNTMSPAIKGAEGVFFITVMNRWETPVPEMPGMFENQQRMLEMQTRNTATGTMMEMLRKNADIDYNLERL